MVSRHSQKQAARKPPWTARNSAGYPAPAGLAVDVVVLTVRDRALVGLAVESSERGLVLPGGFVGETESPDQTAARKLREKTGLRDLYLEQLATFAHPGRDPRGWIPTVAHLALVPPESELGDAGWVSARQPPRLGIDHNRILALAVERVRGKLWWSNVAVGILPGEFTLAQARHVYEAIADTTYDPGTFSRDLRFTGLVEATGGTRHETRGRPAALYAFSDREPAWGAGRRKRLGAHAPGSG